MSQDTQIVEHGNFKPIPRDEQKALMMQNIQSEVALNMDMSRTETDSIQRTEQIIPPAVTRFIDLVEKNEKTGHFEVRRDSFGRPIDIMGALGNIPASQMPYMRISNMNHIAIVLEEDVYFTLYEKDSVGNVVTDERGNPVVIFREAVNLGQATQITQLLNNLAYEYRTAKLQGQVMVGNAGGSPLGVGGSWDNTLDLLFGGSKKK